jgi:hypothetical protein
MIVLEIGPNDWPLGCQFAQQAWRAAQTLK